jgi:hypothetical protein
MDKKDDNKKPSKDKKKDKGKKDKVKKINKSQIVKQSVNIKIGDLSKPKPRRRAAPKAPPPPPQIQRQLQYLPSLAGQAPPPPPAPPAPTPPPAPPRPPAPAAEPRRTGDFFSDTSKSSVFGSSYDLASASLDDLTSIGRAASRPSLTRAFNRPRSDSGVSSLTEPTYADLDFDNYSDFDATAPSRFGSSYDLASMTSEPPPIISTPLPIISEQLGALASFEDIAQPSATQTDDLGSNASSLLPPSYQSDDDSTIPPPPYPSDDDSTIPPPLPSDDESTLPPPPYQSDDESTLPPPKSVNPFLEELKSKLSLPDYGFGNFGLISSNVPMSQPPLGLQPDIVPQDLVLSSQKPKELKIPKPASDAAEERPVKDTRLKEVAVAKATAIEPTIAVPIIEGDPMISETLQAQAQAVKGDIRPEDEATGGGGKKEALIFSDLTTEQKNTLFTMYENEKFEKKVAGQADAISRYNLKTKRGDKISTQQFSKEYLKWKESKKSKKGKK